METVGVAGPVNTGLAAGGVAGPHFLANVLLPWALHIPGEDSSLSHLKAIGLAASV